MPPADRTCVSFANFSQVDETGLVVSAGLYAAQVNVVAVPPPAVLAPPQCLVGEHVDLDADRADRAARGAEGLADLLLLGRAKVLTEGLEELHLVEPVVAAHQGEDDAVVGHDRHRLRSSARIDAEELGDALDRPLAGRLDLLRL